jgi:hypothetical protein
MITRRLCHRPCIGSLPMAMQPFSSVLIPPDQRGRQSAQIGQRALLRAALLVAERFGTVSMNMAASNRQIAASENPLHGHEFKDIFAQPIEQTPLSGRSQ